MTPLRPTLDEKSHRSAAVLLPFVLNWHEELKRLTPTKSMTRITWASSHADLPLCLGCGRA